MAQTMEEYKLLGTLLNRTTFFNLFAQACLTAGQIERGLDAAAESIRIGEQTGERWFEAEAYRLKGELLARQGDLLQAETCFQSASLTAVRQKAKILELRAVASLHQLRQRQGRDSTELRP